MKKVLCVVLAVLLLSAAGCRENKDESPVQSGLEKGGLYKAKVIPVPEKPDDSDDFFYDIMYADEYIAWRIGNHLFFTDYNGNKVSQVSLGGNAGRENRVFDLYVNADGSFWTVTAYFVENPQVWNDFSSMAFIKYDVYGEKTDEINAGNLLEKFREIMSASLSTAFTVSSGGFYLMSNNKIYHWDKTSGFISETPPNTEDDSIINPFSLLTLADGSAVSFSIPENMSASILSKKFSPGKETAEEYAIVSFMNPPGWNYAAPGDDEYDMLICTFEGVYGYNLETDEKTSVFNFIENEIDGSIIGSGELYNFHALPNGDFVFAYMADYKVRELIYYEKINPEDLEGKLINVAAMEVNNELRQFAVDFNKENDEYMVRLNVYNEDNSRDNPDKSSLEAAIQRFNLDFTSGNAPDMIVGDNFIMNMNSYAKKGLLTDFYEIMDNDPGFNRGDYLPNARLNNINIENIITEEAAVYFSGQKSADEVSDIIENRIAIYIAESEQ